MGRYREDAEGALAGAREIAYVRAPNPGPLSLSGTNTWVVGRRPAWIVDPGPGIESHLQRLSAATPPGSSTPAPPWRSTSSGYARRSRSVEASAEWR